MKKGWRTLLISENDIAEYCDGSLSNIGTQPVAYALIRNIAQGNIAQGNIAQGNIAQGNIAQGILS